MGWCLLFFLFLCRDAGRDSAPQPEKFGSNNGNSAKIDQKTTPQAPEIEKFTEI
jgi:hypothetical protein